MLNRNSDQVFVEPSEVFLAVLSLLQMANSFVIAGRKDQEGVTSVSKVKHFEEWVVFESEEGIVLSHFEQVVLAFVHEREMRRLILFHVLGLVVREHNVLSPLGNPFDDVDREHPEGVEVLNELVEVEAGNGFKIFVFFVMEIMVLNVFSQLKLEL